MKPKLFFIINSLQGGGAERVLANLANYFYEKRYTVFVICLNSAPACYKIYSGIKVISLVKRKSNSNVLYRMFYAWLTFYKLLALLVKEKPNCVVSFMSSVNLWTGLTCNILKIPYVVSERISPDCTINQYNYFLKWLSFLIYSKSKAIVIPAKGMIDCFKKNERFKNLDNFKIIHNPVNVFTSDVATKVYYKKYILAVGRLDHQKGFDLLINAYSILGDLDIDLLISGEGNERDNILEQIQQLGLTGRVRLVGFKDNLQDYYQQAEVFVLSSRNEGYPNALVEAMSFGCASIATNCDFGPSEIIKNGKNGLLVPLGDVNELARAILEVLTNPILKSRISKNALLINKSNSIENISLKWENLILSHV